MYIDSSLIKLTEHQKQKSNTVCCKFREDLKNLSVLVLQIIWYANQRLVLGFLLFFIFWGGSTGTTNFAWMPNQNLKKIAIQPLWNFWCNATLYDENG